jgi:hypothetical protein
VWADSNEGSKYLAIEKFPIVDEVIDLELAKQTALEKCRGRKGWENCEIASSIVNGVVAIARDNRRALRTRFASDPDQARAGLRAKCKSDRVECVIEKIVDGRAEYF